MIESSDIKSVVNGDVLWIVYGLTWISMYQHICEVREDRFVSKQMYEVKIRIGLYILRQS